MTTTSNALVNSSSSTSIPSITSSTTSTAFPTNTWGYSTASGSSDTITYNPIPTGTTTLKDTSTASTDIIPFTIATKVDLSNPAGTYTNTFSFSAVAKLLSYTITWNSMGGSTISPTTVVEGSPIGTLPAPTKDGYNLLGWYTTEVEGGEEITENTIINSNVTYYARWEKLKTLSEIANMQEMTSAICAASAVNETKQLIDTRSGNEAYLVGKLADGKCWMLDNLRLGGTSAIELHNTDTHMDAASWTLPASSTDKFSDNTAGWTTPGINTASKDKTTTSYGSGSGKIGVYYNFCAASAGTYCYASGSGTGDATQDICPKNWRMPTGGGGSGEYRALYTAYSSNATNFRSALSTPLSGGFGNSAFYQGDYGYFWSSTRDNGSDMYNLRVSSSGVYPTDYRTRYYGYSVRCVAQ